MRQTDNWNLMVLYVVLIFKHDGIQKEFNLHYLH